MTDIDARCKSLPQQIYDAKIQPGTRGRDLGNALANIMVADRKAMRALLDAGMHYAWLQPVGDSYFLVAVSDNPRDFTPRDGSVCSIDGLWMS